MSTGAPDSDRHERAVVFEERARAFLAEGELELLGRIPWASNATVLARVTHGELEGLAVYKPVRGERPLCPLCGNPLDPAGHICPAMNGHRPGAT